MADDFGMGMVDDFGDFSSTNQDIDQGSQNDTYDQKQAIQTARGVTPTNPFGYNNPFQSIADFFGTDVNYNNIMSQGAMDQIAQQGYNRYVDPMNSGTNLNRGFGSLFSSSLGEQTGRGVMREQKPDALSGKDTAALTAFSLLGGGLPSLMANQLANPSTFVPEKVPQYDPSRDPMNKDYDAETYDKGYIENTIDALYGTGATQQATTLVEDAINYLTNAGKP